jgi:DNA polymerase I-like protein with 3'-5' exonuclease and polymerase domains
VILIGSEAVKEFTTTTNVSDHTGRIIQGKPQYGTADKFIASISPAMLAFKPETRPAFEATVEAIKAIVAGNAKKDVTEGDYRAITTHAEAYGYLMYILQNKHVIPCVGLDSETSALQARHGYILGVSVSHKLHQGVYIDADIIDAELVTLLQAIIEEIPVAFHNAKFDMHFFSFHLGINFSTAKQLHDTMIQHYLLDERQGTHGLKSLTIKYGSLGDYDSPLEKFKEDYCHRTGLKKDDFTYDLIPWEIISEYAAKDTAATLELHYKFLPLIESNPKLRSCYYDLMIPSLLFLTKMEARGIPISVARLKAARSYLDSELTKLYAQLYSYEIVKELEAEQGGAFNPNSTKQLRVLLFDKLLLNHSGKLTATGALSTDAEVLEELSHQHPLPKVILDIRQQTKLINTYIDKLLPVVDMDQKVRTGFNLTTTTSGRLSSSGNFNVQQLPRDNPIIKGCVKARNGYKIVAVD